MNNPDREPGDMPWQPANRHLGNGVVDDNDSLDTISESNRRMQRRREETADMIPLELRVRCLHCSHVMGYVGPTAPCEQCGSRWVEAIYDYGALEDVLKEFLHWRAFDMWRYRELLPFPAEESISSLSVGGTPLIRADNLAMQIGCRHLYLKDERRSPSGSCHDREAAVVVSEMKWFGSRGCVILPTGSAACSFAALCARAGVETWAVFPKSSPRREVQRLTRYGAQIVAVEGNYAKAAMTAGELAGKKGLHLYTGARSMAAREGMKTMAFEIAEQMGWQMPDWYVDTLGTGTGLLGVWKAFKELVDLGLAEHVPALACVCREGHPLLRVASRMEDGLAGSTLSSEIRTSATCAEEIDGTCGFVRQAVLSSGGIIEAVSMNESVPAGGLMAQKEGISADVTTAMALAGVAKLVRKGVIRSDSVVVINLGVTG